MQPIQEFAKLLVHLEVLTSEREVLDLLTRFDDAAIRTDTAAFRQLWTDEAVWEIGDPIPMRAEGKEAIVAALVQLHTQNQFFFRLTARPIITLTGNKGTLRAPTVELAGRDGGRAYANVAFYEDEVERDQSGLWRFTKRSYRYVWVDVNSRLGGQSVALSGGKA